MINWIWSIVCGHSVSFSAVTLLVMSQKGHLACKKVGCWFVGSFARIIAPIITTTSVILSSNKSRMETFWYWLAQVHLENGRWTGEGEGYVVILQFLKTVLV